MSRPAPPGSPALVRPRATPDRLRARVEALRVATERDVTDRVAWLRYCRRVQALCACGLARDLPPPEPPSGPLLNLAELVSTPLQGLAEALTPPDWSNGPEYRPNPESEPAAPE